MRAVIHGAQGPPEGSRPDAHYRGTGTSPRLPGGAAACDAATDVSARAARRQQRRPPERAAGHAPRPPLPSAGERARGAAHEAGANHRHSSRRWPVQTENCIVSFSERGKKKHYRVQPDRTHQPPTVRIYLPSGGGHRSSELAGMCQSSFIVVKQAKNGQWRMLTYTEGI